MSFEVGDSIFNKLIDTLETSDYDYYSLFSFQVSCSDLIVILLNYSIIQ